MIILGLVTLVAALIVGVAGVMGNGGGAHAVGHFLALGYHVTGSAGLLFLAGIVVGAVGLAGLSLLLVGARRTSRRGSAARRALRQSRRETAPASQEGDDLTGQRDTARACTASQPSKGTVIATRNLQPSPVGDRWGRLRELGHRLVPAQTAAPRDASARYVPASEPGPEVTASSTASDAPADAPEPDVAGAFKALDAQALRPRPQSERLAVRCSCPSHDLPASARTVRPACRCDTHEQLSHCDSDPCGSRPSRRPGAGADLIRGGAPSRGSRSRAWRTSRKRCHAVITVRRRLRWVDAMGCLPGRRSRAFLPYR
jgi:hypothetical protein